MLGQDFSAARARLSCSLKVEGTQLDEDQMLLHPRGTKMSPQFPSLYRWVCCCSPAMDQSKSWPLTPLPLLLELVGMRCRQGGWKEAVADDGPVPSVDDERPEIPHCAAQFICCSIWTCLKFLSKPGLKSWLLKAPFFT